MYHSVGEPVPSVTVACAEVGGEVTAPRMRGLHFPFQYVSGMMELKYFVSAPPAKSSFDQTRTFGFAVLASSMPSMDCSSE